MSFEINIARRTGHHLQKERSQYEHYCLMVLPNMLSLEANDRFREVVQAYPYPEFACTLYERTEYRTTLKRTGV